MATEIPARAAPVAHACMVGVDALGGQSFCLACARFKRLGLGENDNHGKVITAISSTDEFVDIMECSRCGRYILPPRWVKYIKDRP